MSDPRSELLIRRYRATDHTAVRALHDASLHDVGAHLDDGRWDDDLNAIEQIYLEGDGEFLVGTIAGEIVAMGALRRTGRREATLTRMRVATHRQGRGLGTEMLEALEARARELGVTRLHLDTTTRQRAALALYRGHGFQMTGTGRQGESEVIFFEKAL